MLTTRRGLVLGLIVLLFGAGQVIAEEACSETAPLWRQLDALDPALLDAERVGELLVEAIDTCPTALGRYRDLALAYDPPEFWDTHLPVLTRAVAARPLVEQIEALPTLWSLEFRRLPIERHPDQRRQVAALGPRLQALDQRTNDAWWRVMLAVHEIAGDRRAAQDLQAAWRQERPCADESIAHALGDIAAQWADDADLGQIESDQVHFLDAHRDAARAVLLDLQQRCPDHPRPPIWLAVVDATIATAESPPEAPKAAESEPTAARQTWVDTSFLRCRDVIEPLTDWRIDDTAGRRWTHGDLVGKTTLIQLWATWSDNSLATLPWIHQLAEDLADDPDFQVLTLNVDRHRRVARQFMKRQGATWTFPVLLSRPDLRTSGLELPQTWLVDADGVVRRKSIGVGETMAPEHWIAGMRAELERLHRRRARASQDGAQ